MIKTVIIFLRDLLPVFILFAYLQSLYPAFFKIKMSSVWKGLGAALVVISVKPLLELSNDWFDGTGPEWVSICLILVVVTGMLLLTAALNRYRSAVIWTTIICFTGLKFSSFLLYFSVEMTTSDSLGALIVSSVMGLGICVSFYILWSFVLNEVYGFKPAFVGACIPMFVAGQAAKVVNHLHQIDAISIGSNRLGSVEHYISEQSELGHILKALVGFESVPSQLFIVVYVLTAIAVFTNFYRNKI